MLEILTLTYGDNAVPGAETTMIADLGADLGFTADELATMKGWAERNCRLLDEAQGLMAG